MICSRCDTDHLEDGVIVETVPEFMCRGALMAERDSLRARVKDLEEVLPIDPIVKQVRRIWKKYPSMRFGQLMEYIKSLNEGPVDSFYVEDREWVILLKSAR